MLSFNSPKGVEEMNARRRVILLLSTLLVLTGCVFDETKTENIILQVSSSNDSRAVELKQSNYRQETEYVEEPMIGTKLNNEIYLESQNSQGISWLATKVQDATDAVRSAKVVHTYNLFDEKISTVVVPGTEEITPATGVVYEYGKNAQVGAFWNPRVVTRYGYDCGGCSVNEEGFSGTASGIKTSGTQVRQANGTWKDGYTYEGYYIIATSKAIPLGTVVRISDHPFSGGGIVAGQPFNAIVGNRGVSGSSIDLFAGTETNLNVISQSGSPSRSNTKVEIISFRGI